MKLTYHQKADLLYRINAMDNHLAQLEPNLMSIVWADWNVIKIRIQKLLSIED